MKTGDMMTVRYDTINMEIPDMLDAFIIDKIQRERELHETGRESLRIDAPREPEEKRNRNDSAEKRERGVEIVDFNI